MAEDDWGPVQTLRSVGATQTPARASIVPPTASIEMIRRLVNAMAGGSPITTDQMVRGLIHEPLIAAQGLRDLLDLVHGKPKQEPGRLMPFDPYNPFQGGA